MEKYVSKYIDENDLEVEYDIRSGKYGYSIKISMTHEPTKICTCMQCTKDKDIDFSESYIDCYNDTLKSIENKYLHKFQETKPIEIKKYKSKYIDEDDLIKVIKTDVSNGDKILKIKHKTLGEYNFPIFFNVDENVYNNQEYINICNSAIQLFENLYLKDNEIKQNKTNTNDLINAVNIIKSECKKHDDGDILDCGRCPLGNDKEECVLHSDYPLYWNVLDEPVERILIGDGENDNK